MHQNTFLSTPDGQKNLFWRNDSGGLEMCANACKHVFKHSRRSKISFLKQKNSGCLEACANASKHVFGGLKACANASKHVFGGL